MLAAYRSSAQNKRFGKHVVASLSGIIQGRGKPFAPKAAAAYASRQKSVCENFYTNTRQNRVYQTIASSSADMSASTAKSVLVPIANGSEEMEAVVTIDVLRRAGAHVTVASVEKSLEVTCSRGVKIVCDTHIDDCRHKHYDLIACPGGMPGAERLRDCQILEELIRKQRDRDGLYAAICATPAVFFQPKGFIGEKFATAHPAFTNKLPNQRSVESRVVVDGNLTTSRGPGTSFEFALSLVSQLYGEAKAQEVAKPMVMYNY